MEEGSSAERWIAVEAFGLMGVVAREKHAVKISARLEDESNFVRRSALKIMRQLRDTELWPFARNLARRVDDEDVEIRREAVVAIRELGNPGRQFASLIAKRLADDDIEVRHRALDALTSKNRYV